MPSVDIVRETPVSRTIRARQLESVFDVPASERSRLSWSVNAPINEGDAGYEPWRVGLIVGPSGSGKSTVARELFPGEVGRECEWRGASVVDDFSPDLSVEDISRFCSSVGFNTIPAWLRPFSVLSNGEQFRVTLARRLAEETRIVFDEFTSVVDRQVAQIASHAVQRTVRATPDKQFVAVTCHEDVTEWLQPDWIIRLPTGEFSRRSVQRRPPLSVEIGPVDKAAWRVFSSFHYLTADLHKSAYTFGLWVNGRLAAFAGMLYRPYSQRQSAFRPIIGVSRVVTLPDYQGLGLAFVLLETLGAAFAAYNVRTTMYPAHPPLVRSFDRSPKWVLRRKPGTPRVGPKRSTARNETYGASAFAMGGRPCAVFEYVGPRASPEDAKRLLSGYPDAFWHKHARSGAAYGSLGVRSSGT